MFLAFVWCTKCDLLTDKKVTNRKIKKVFQLNIWFWGNSEIFKTFFLIPIVYKLVSTVCFVYSSREANKEILESRSLVDKLNSERLLEYLKFLLKALFMLL